MFNCFDLDVLALTVLCCTQTCKPDLCLWIDELCFDLKLIGRLGVKNPPRAFWHQNSIEGVIAITNQSTHGQLYPCLVKDVFQIEPFLLSLQTYPGPPAVQIRMVQFWGSAAPWSDWGRTATCPGRLVPGGSRGFLCFNFSWLVWSCYYI